MESGGGRRLLYIRPRVGESGFAAGGQGGHGAAKPDGGIHRYAFKPEDTFA